MTVKIKRRNKSPVRTDSPDIERSVEDIVASINDTFDSVQGSLIDRQTEVEAIKYAMLAGEHVMLDGPPGVAKSLLVESVFNQIQGARVFKKRMMKGTQPEEVFGPMKIHRLRTDSVVEFNTENMLPEADFAYLDEIYRASDLLLSAKLGILNEREFINGHLVMKCPLMTAIGTTNFVTESDELEAYNDRWLIQIKVENLESTDSRVRMYAGYLNYLQKIGRVVAVRPRPTVQELRFISERCKQVDFSDEMFQLFDELVNRYLREITTRGKSKYVGDRRRCQLLKLAQVAAFLRDPTSFKVEEDDLYAVRMGLITLNDKDETSKFDTAFEQSVSAYKKKREEVSEATLISKGVSRIVAQYDPSLPEDKLRQIRGMCVKVIEGVQNRPQPFEFSESIKMIAAAVEQAEQVRNSIAV